jgi:hypothetical protein
MLIVILVFIYLALAQGTDKAAFIIGSKPGATVSPNMVIMIGNDFRD